jgi:hypothetical protein
MSPGLRLLAALAFTAACWFLLYLTISAALF